MNKQQQKQIDKLLMPVFDTVRTNKINSFFQLTRYQKQKLEKPEKSYIFQSMQPTTNQQIQSMSKTQHFRFNFQKNYSDNQKMPKTSQFTRRNNPQQGTNFITLQPKHRKLSKQQNNNTEIMRKIVRTRSKAKKHLVENIDFDKIQKLFHKKRQIMNRYEHFLQTKVKQRQKQKEKGGSASFVGRNNSERKSSLNLSIKPINNSFGQFETFTLDLSQKQISQTISFKNSPKKKFWFRQQNASVRRSFNSNIAEKPNQQIQRIQGKSFKSIKA